MSRAGSVTSSDATGAHGANATTGIVRARMRLERVIRCFAVVAGCALVTPVIVPVGSVGADTEAEQAAQEIADARDRANAAADAMFEAESRLDALEGQQQELEGEIKLLEQRIRQLREAVEGVAINRYTRSGTASLPLLTGFRSAGDQAQIDVLIDVVNETSADDFDEFDALSSDLADARDELSTTQEETRQARTDLEQRRDEALAEVERLKDVEAGRLEDEAVAQALAAEEAERRRQEDLDAKAEAVRLATAPRSGAATDGDGDIDGDADGSTNEGTGGSGGGQTGVSGLGGRPGGIDPGVDFGLEGWACPVQGPVAFGDTWGAPRSGGRRHQGVDIIGGRGLPIVAVVDGFAQQKVNSLGGNSVWLTGVDNNKYYYAHLDSWATAGPVTVGTVLGYLGDSGNARFSVPHLHFEIHPGGGAAVNPYPTVRAHC